ncbi:MAG: HAMP domain-containing sensor histidine kinase [Myxococcota bacterium]|nr:HAMP domain-containing sensor histidine kinase [Myxococcota bacterium]
MLSCERPQALVGRGFLDDLLDTGDGLPVRDGKPKRCSVRFSDGAPAELLARRVSSGDDELWFISDGDGVPESESVVPLLAEASTEAASLRAKLKERDEERDDFLALLGHELRTPITVIGGYGRLLLSGEAGALSEIQQRYVSQALKSCKHLDALVESMLEISSWESLDRVIAPSSLSLHTLITDTCESLAPLLSARSIEVEIDVDPRADSAFFDAIRIGQVLSNLLGNAIRFSEPGGKVRIGARPSSRSASPCVEIYVLDQGCGIEESQLDRIFEPYVRGLRGQERCGHGLGLAISRRIVRAHRGDIWAENEPGGGARFAFTLSADRCAKPQDGEESVHG